MTVSARSRRQAAPRAAAADRTSGARTPAARGLRGRLAEGLARPRQLAAGWERLAIRRKVPASLRDRLSLERGERVLTVSRDPENGYALVATDRALYHRDVRGWSRSGWERIAAVGWDSAAERLVISALSPDAAASPGAAATPRRTSLPLRERGTVPEVADERITHTRLGRWPVPLPGGKQVIAEARRSPATGELSWFVVPDGTAPGPAGRQQLGAALARLSAELGFGSQPGGSGVSPRLPRR